jgi:hypothetical protein
MMAALEELCLLAVQVGRYVSVIEGDREERERCFRDGHVFTLSLGQSVCRVLGFELPDRALLSHDPLRRSSHHLRTALEPAVGLEHGFETAVVVLRDPGDGLCVPSGLVWPMVRTFLKQQPAVSDPPRCHSLSPPQDEFVEPLLRRLDDLAVELLDEPVDGRIFDRLEHPVAMLDPQVLQHGERPLALFDDRLKRDHDFGDSCLQLERRGFRVSDVGDDELRHAR